MQVRLIWDETKRTVNLVKHGLDFARVHLVLNSRYRLCALFVRGGEERVQSISYVFEVFSVLTMVHTDRDGGCADHQLSPRKQRRKRGLR